MNKRWIVLVGLLAVCACLALAVLAMFPPRPSVTDASFERIENGMTMTEVESILAGPSAAGSLSTQVWTGDERLDGTLFVVIDFDAQSRVVAKNKVRRELTFIEKLLVRWLPSQII